MLDGAPQEEASNDAVAVYDMLREELRNYDPKMLRYARSVVCVCDFCCFLTVVTVASLWLCVTRWTSKARMRRSSDCSSIVAARLCLVYRVAIAQVWKSWCCTGAAASHININELLCIF